MSKSKIACLVPIVLLLVRSLVPVVHGQISPLEWSHKISDPVKLHNMQQSVLSNADRTLLSNPNKYWPDPGFVANTDRGLVNFPALLHKNVGLHLQQQLPPNIYLLLNDEQKYLSPHGLPMPSTSGVDVQEALNPKLSYMQPRKRQSIQKETDISLAGSGPSIDYSSDDDISAQLIQPPAPNPDDFVQSTPPYKTRMSTKQPIVPSGLARYLFFSTIKRARDGYICHFKLCQVGVSGKRLSNNNM